MGESVESVMSGSIDRTSYIIERNQDFLEEDIDRLEDFQARVNDMDLGNSVSSSESLMHTSNAPSDTEKVIEWYDELHYSREKDLDIVDSNAQKLDISKPAAHFLQELLNIENIDDRDAYRKINFLDSKNDMAPQHKEEVVSLVEYPKANRRQMIERLDIS